MLLREKENGVIMELIGNRKLINLGGLIKDVRQNDGTWWLLIKCVFLFIILISAFQHAFWQVILKD